MKRSIFLILFLFFYSSISEAQDIHFTQYYASPLTLNPATAGFFEGTQRFSLQNKTQWQSVTVPFRTLSASFDMPILKRDTKHDIFGGGISIYRDQEGDSKFGTTQVNLSLSYIRSLNKANDKFISFGIQTGVAQRTIDYSQLVFDSQWDGISFNPNLSNNEHFSKENFIFFDCSAGAYWSCVDKNKNETSIGVSLFHINTPKQSLFDNDDVRLARKLLINASKQIKITDNLKLVPGILFMHQGTYNEFDVGSLVKLIKISTTEKYLALSVGMYYRSADALNFIVGLDFKDMMLGVSYDINTSNLTPASHSRGGLELSLIYILNKAKQDYVKHAPCPIF